VLALLLAPSSAWAQSEEERLAADLANPLATVTTVLGQYRTEFDLGPDDEMNHQLRLNPSFFVPRPGGSAFLLRSIVPFLGRNWPVDASGLGDITLAPYYVPDTSRSTFLAYGAAVGLPTATDDALGSGKWTAGPAILFAHVGQPATWGALVQHLRSLFGDEARADVNVSTVQPFLNYLLGDGWAATFTSEISYNWEAVQDELTLPLQVGATKVVGVGGRFFNLGATGVWYARGSDFLPGGELRINVTYVFR
jgi:hypothetical protein